MYLVGSVVFHVFIHSHVTERRGNPRWNINLAAMVVGGWSVSECLCHITTAEVLSSSITLIFIPSLFFISQVRGARSDVDCVWPVRGFDLSVGGGGRVARVVVGRGRDLLVIQI